MRGSRDGNDCRAASARLTAAIRPKWAQPRGNAVPRRGASFPEEPFVAGAEPLSRQPRRRTWGLYDAPVQPLHSFGWVELPGVACQRDSTLANRQPDESVDPPPGEVAVEYEDLGRRYLTDAVEQDLSVAPAVFEEEYEDLELSLRAADDLLRSFRREPLSARRRSGVHAVAPQVRRPNGRSPDSLPEDARDYGGSADELDLTDEAIHEVSLLDHEGEEAGEVRSPWLRTEDTRSHGKPRGGHARGSLRPLTLKR